MASLSLVRSPFAAATASLVQKQGSAPRSQCITLAAVKASAFRGLRLRQQTRRTEISEAEKHGFRRGGVPQATRALAGAPAATAAASAALASSLLVTPDAAAATVEASSAVIEPFMASMLSQCLVVAEISPEAASAVGAVLGPLFAGFNFLFIIRIVMSWYPQLPVTEMPYVLVYAPTEPILRLTRAVIQPVGGVDISAIVWLAIVSFLNEILLGQQGLLVLIAEQQAIM
eukprot:TRINITY_DN78301_c0_g1_i1.p1 TRINITY_DN78301_c0_g1~~TRINITY_DN78301_c0_g1_i1.p1  ORF type:complete len:230 (+),score=26.04 TRINITY_DN78301_c0_g1_i1:393-1082(+)